MDECTMFLLNESFRFRLIKVQKYIENKPLKKRLSTYKECAVKTLIGDLEYVLRNYMQKKFNFMYVYTHLILHNIKVVYKREETTVNLTIVTGSLSDEDNADEFNPMKLVEAEKQRMSYKFKEYINRDRPEEYKQLLEMLNDNSTYNDPAYDANLYSAADHVVRHIPVRDEGFMDEYEDSDEEWSADGCYWDSDDSDKDDEENDPNNNNNIRIYDLKDFEFRTINLFNMNSNVALLDDNDDYLNFQRNNVCNKLFEEIVCYYDTVVKLQNTCNLY
nr:Caab139 [Calliteara abietis nucleopolyhedrovirus]